MKRELPRIPFYPDFWQWADWGKTLMDLHIGYEAVAPWPLKRTDLPDEKARQAGMASKALLKIDKEAGRITLDSETTLAGVPPEAWDYRLGTRSPLIDLLARVATVSVATVKITREMRAARP